METMKKVLSMLLILAMMFAGININSIESSAVTKNPTKITLNAKSKTLTVGRSFQLKVKTVNPKKSSKSVTYKSSNKKIAMVNSKGKVTAKRTGKATITVTSRENRKVKAICKVTVKKTAVYTKNPVNITLNVKSKTLAEGKSFQLKVKTVKPKNASKEVTYKSSDKKIATVSSKGKVTAKKAGTVIITVSSRKNAKVKAKCRVTVTKKTVPTKKPVPTNQLTQTMTATPEPTMIYEPTPAEVKDGIQREEFVENILDKIQVNMVSENDLPSEDGKTKYSCVDIASCREPLKIETAYACGMIPIENEQKVYFRPEEYVTKEYASYVIINALGMMDEDATLMCNDKDQLNYQMQDALAVICGLFSLENGNFLPTKYITQEEMSAILAFMESVLAKRVIDESHQDVLVVSEDVNQNFTEATSYEKIDTKEESVIYQVSLNNETRGIQVGDVITLPKNQDQEEGLTVEVISLDVTEEENLIYMEVKDPDNFFDVYESVDIQGYANLEPEYFECAEGVTKIEEEQIDEGEIQEEKINFSGSYNKKLEEKLSVKLGEETTANVKFSIKSIEYKLDYNKFKVNDLYLKCNTSAEVGLKGKADVVQEEQSKVKLGSYAIPVSPGIKIKVVFYLVPTLDASYNIAFELDGTYGVQYVNHHMVKIFDVEPNVKVQVTGETGLGIRIDLGIYLFDEIDEVLRFFHPEKEEPKPLYNMGVEVGVKAKGEIKRVVTDYIVCIDIATYVYGELYSGEGSWIEEVFGSDKVKFSQTLKVWDEKHSVYKVNLHMETNEEGDYVYVKKCTRGEKDNVVTPGVTKIPTATITKSPEEVKDGNDNDTDVGGDQGIKLLKPGNYRLFASDHGSPYRLCAKNNCTASYIVYDYSFEKYEKRQIRFMEEWNSEQYLYIGPEGVDITVESGNMEIISLWESNIELSVKDLGHKAVYGWILNAGDTLLIDNKYYDGNIVSNSVTVHGGAVTDNMVLTKKTDYWWNKYIGWDINEYEYKDKWTEWYSYSESCNKVQYKVLEGTVKVYIDYNDKDRIDFLLGEENFDVLDQIKEITISVKKDEFTNSPHCYIYTDNGQCTGAWPGMRMSDNGEFWSLKIKGEEGYYFIISDDYGFRSTPDGVPGLYINQSSLYTKNGSIVPMDE